MRRPGGRPPLALAILVLALAGHAAAQAQEQETEADLQIEFADRLFQIRFYDAAVAEYRKFLADHPKDPRREQARYQLAVSYFKLGGEKEYNRALAELVTLRKEFPNGERLQDCLFYTGHVRYVLGDHEGAIADLDELAKLDVRPDLKGPMLHFLGRAHYDLGHYPAAVEYLGAVAEAPKETELRPFALIILADAHLKMDKPGESAAALEQLLADYPDLRTKDELWLKLGDVRLAFGRHEDALAAYSSVDLKSEFGGRAAIGRGRALLGLQKYTEAAEACTELLADFQETPDTKALGIQEQACYIIGVADFNLDKHQGAANAFAKVLENVQQGAMAEDSAYRLCWSNYRLGPDLARKLVASCVTFRRLFPSSEHTAQVIFLAAEGYRRLQDYDSAVAQYKQIGEDTPHYADALYRIAYCYHRQSKPDEAARAYDLFNARFVRHSETAAALAAAGALYQAAEQYEEAVKRYEKYLAETPEGAEGEEVAYQLGICFARMSRFDEMARAFAAYVQEHSEGKYAGAAYRWLGRHHRVRGDELAAKPDAAAAAEEYELAEQALRSGVALGGAEQEATLLALAECGYNLGKIRADQAAELAARAKGAGDAERPDLAKQAAEFARKAEDSFQIAAKGFLELIVRKPELVTNESVHFWTGTYLREQKDSSSAIMVFEELIKKFPESKKMDTALYELAMLYAQSEPPDLKLAIESCDKLLAAFPESPFALQAKFAKAEALRRQTGSSKEAEALYMEVARRSAALLKVKSTVRLGHICFDRKEYAAAARYFAEVGLLYEDEAFTPQALYFAGKANALLGDAGDAVKFWRQLLTNYPDSQWARTAGDDLPELGFKVGPGGAILKE